MEVGRCYSSGQFNAEMLCFYMRCRTHLHFPFKIQIYTCWTPHEYQAPYWGLQIQRGNRTTCSLTSGNSQFIYTYLMLLSKYPLCIPHWLRNDGHQSYLPCLNSCRNKDIFQTQYSLSIVLLCYQHLLFSLSIYVIIIECLGETYIFKARVDKSIKLKLAWWTNPEECY